MRKLRTDETVRIEVEQGKVTTKIRRPKNEMLRNHEKKDRDRSARPLRKTDTTRKRRANGDVQSNVDK